MIMSKFKKLYRDFFSLKEQKVTYSDAEVDNLKKAADEAERFK